MEGINGGIYLEDCTWLEVCEFKLQTSGRELDSLHRPPAPPPYQQLFSGEFSLLAEGR